METNKYTLLHSQTPIDILDVRMTDMIKRSSNCVAQYCRLL